MSIIEIQSYIEAVEKDSSLCEEKNFDKRIEAINFIGYHVIDQIEDCLLKTDQRDQLLLFKNRAEKLRTELEEIDIILFQKLRTNIRQLGSTGQGFKNLIEQYVDLQAAYTGHREEIGYDNLDILMNGLSPFQTMPEQTIDLEPEMVYYQKTPARIIFELVGKTQFTKEDVFFDLGAGLGQVTILVNLLTGIKARGVEFEPAFCDYARECAASLNLSGVSFLNVDARKADYSEGTIFFMFTPFKGEILKAVLEILRKESLQRKIKIVTYGPCTAQVALQSWLDFAPPRENEIYKLWVFSSI